MLCQNCGREVEFNGNVCPWCGAQKVQSQVTHIYSYFWGFLGAGGGGFIGYQINPEVGWLIGGGIGLVVGVVFGFSKGSSALNQNVKCPTRHPAGRHRIPSLIMAIPMCLRRRWPG